MTVSSEPGRDALADPPVTPRQLRFITLLVTGAMFMEILDGSIIATALPQMAHSFGTTALELNLGISAYLLALGTFIPVSGWVAERLGARTVFALAVALFTLTSALCGMADSLHGFLGLRVLQGISGAMMVPVGRLVVLKYTPRERLMATMSALVWPALIAPVIGPPLGGFITTYAGWRWIFYLNVPLGLAALAAVLSLVPNVREAVRRRFDWPGFLLCTAGVFALLSGLERLPLAADRLALLLLAVGGVLTALAIRHFLRAEQPMLRLSAFSIPTFRAVLRGGALVRVAVGSAPFLLPLMFQVGFGYDAFRSGLLVLAVFAGNLAMKSVTTPILRRFGYRPVMIWNGLACVMTLSLCALIQPGMPLPLIFVILLASGMTRSMQFTTQSTLAFADIPKQELTDANGLFNAASQLIMAASVTLGAMAVRAGQAVSAAAGSTAAGAGYRLAFLFVAAIALVGLIDAVRLPRGAGDHFVSRKR